MEKIEWVDALTLGVKDIDDDHQDLVGCYNSLFQAIFSKDGSFAITVALETFVQHTESHFHREEVLMNSVGYPDLVSHKAEHQALLVSMRLLQQRRLSDGSRTASCHRFAFLHSWLLNHIVDTDKELAQFILQLQAADSSDPVTEELEFVLAESFSRPSVGSLKAARQLPHSAIL